MPWEAVQPQQAFRRSAELADTRDVSWGGVMTYCSNKPEMKQMEGTVKGPSAILSEIEIGIYCFY